MRKATILGVSGAALLLAGCQTTGSSSAFGNRCQIGGTLLGGIAGGLLGSMIGRGDGNIIAILAGVAAGAYLGNQIGSKLDCDDQQAAAVANQQAADAQVGERIYWTSSTAKESAEAAQKSHVEASRPALPPAPSPAPVATASAPQRQSTTQAQRSSAPRAGSAQATTPPAGSTTVPPAGGWVVVEPNRPATPSSQQQQAAATAPQRQPAATPAATSGWEVREPVVSQGQSGMWGWSEPAGEPTRSADGRMCRQIRQTVVDQRGGTTQELVTSCQDAERRWVVSG